MGEFLLEDTIAAIATALGEGGIGVVRVSGPLASTIGQRIFRTGHERPVEFARRRGFFYGRLLARDEQSSVDECILLWMPGPHSYTGEDVVEFQVHGGIRVVQSALAVILEKGARLAEPGEFTRRAFLNGRMDLSQAEAVMDLIRAKTDLAARVAFSQVEGSLSREIGNLRRQVLELQAELAVTLDYPEHDDEIEVAKSLVLRGQALLMRMQDVLDNAKTGVVVREGVLTPLIGQPNVGKSSLLNELLRRQRAIVTEIPGTTRDVLEESVDLGGVLFRLVDTAGIRETKDRLEQLGVERSRAAVHSGELILLVLDGSRELETDDLQLLTDTANRSRIVVVNKADLAQQITDEKLVDICGRTSWVRVSATTGEGLSGLRDLLIKTVLGGDIEQVEPSFLTNARQTQLLLQAREDLATAISAAQAGLTLDVVAVLLQSVYALLGLVVGAEAGEDLLDEVFSRFCLGK
ncbi:tRNA uridine-5-carboxymethylaminomethyl(34) synthesis GTPase MnmE [Alicyclobacillaceae bacterium I2511]|nr:tRNA uridine-5-carboxymethylaminomethyl(34) synthesis GTPase MnmE [Alicyclobacillaceae bacterium I2511]